MLCRHVFGKISSEFRGISCVFVNFAGFRGFTWNSRLRDRAKYQKPWPIKTMIQNVLSSLSLESQLLKTAYFKLHMVMHNRIEPYFPKLLLASYPGFTKSTTCTRNIILFTKWQINWLFTGWKSLSATYRFPLSSTKGIFFFAMWYLSDGSSPLRVKIRD